MTSAEPTTVGADPTTVSDTPKAPHGFPRWLVPRSRLPSTLPPRLLPRRLQTVRFRLTVMYGGLFLLAGTALLVITYLLMARHLPAPAAERTMGRLTVLTASEKCTGGPYVVTMSGGDPAVLPSEPSSGCVLLSSGRLRAIVHAQRAGALHALVADSAIALAMMTVTAAGLGWLMAGRALRPLREITATAQHLSTRNLAERIGLQGPDDELKNLADTIDAMLDRLARAFESQRRFVANVSHELRTPLTVQRTATEIALANPHSSTASLRLMARQVHAATLRHDQLIDSLLMLARSERGVECFEPADLADAARSAIITAQAALEAADLTISHDLRPAPVLGDDTLLERLVANLVENAVHHNVPGGHLAVETDHDGRHATVHVWNTGPALPAEIVEELFQPFRRYGSNRTAVSAHQGFGLGLSIVAAIVDAHNGNRVAHARKDGGLDIVISLPTAPPAAWETVKGKGASL